MASRNTFDLDLRAVIYRDQQWRCAHCLELDLVASADTSQQAVVDLAGSIRIQLEHAMRTGRLDSILRPAPPEYWEMYFRAGRTKVRLPKTRHGFEIRELAA